MRDEVKRGSFDKRELSRELCLHWIIRKHDCTKNLLCNVMALFISFFCLKITKYSSLIKYMIFRKCPHVCVRASMGKAPKLRNINVSFFNSFSSQFFDFSKSICYVLYVKISRLYQ